VGAASLACRSFGQYVRKNSAKSEKGWLLNLLFYPVSVVLIIAKAAKDFIEQGFFAAAA
jgi:hypothetical protein